MVGHSGTGRRDKGGVRHGSILRDIHFSYMHGVPAQRSTVHTLPSRLQRRRQIATSPAVMAPEHGHDAACVDDATSTHEGSCCDALAGHHVLH